MRGILREPSTGAWIGRSLEQVGENPTVISNFPVDFSDTGNFCREWLAEDWIHRHISKQCHPPRIDSPEILCYSLPTHGQATFSKSQASMGFVLILTS